MSTTEPFRSELAATFKSVFLDNGGGDVLASIPLMNFLSRPYSD
jgi:hypothetical protein